MKLTMKMIILITTTMMIVFVIAVIVVIVVTPVVSPSPLLQQLRLLPDGDSTKTTTSASLVRVVTNNNDRVGGGGGERRGRGDHRNVDHDYYDHSTVVGSSSTTHLHHSNLPNLHKTQPPPLSYRTVWYNQTLDHISPTSMPSTTFPQRILINDTYYGHPSTTTSSTTTTKLSSPTCKGPIFFYTGNEGSIEGFWNADGFMQYLTVKYGGLIVMAEQRGYGQSLLPSRTGKTTTNNRTTTTTTTSSNKAATAATAALLMTTQQVLEDYVEILQNVIQPMAATTNATAADNTTTTTTTTTTTNHCPVIAFGGSYGGTLTAYLRLKYPWVVHGALAASSEVAYYDTQSWSWNHSTSSSTQHELRNSSSTTNYDDTNYDNIDNPSTTKTTAEVGDRSSSSMMRTRRGNTSTSSSKNTKAIDENENNNNNNIDKTDDETNTNDDTNDDDGVFVTEYTFSDTIGKQYYDISPHCLQRIWNISDMIDTIGYQHPQMIVDAFNFCNMSSLLPYPSSTFIYALEGLPQMNYPYEIGSRPAWPVRAVCDILLQQDNDQDDGDNHDHDDNGDNHTSSLLHRAARVTAMALGYNLSSSSSSSQCFEPLEEGPGNIPGDGPGVGSWGLQSCIETIHMFSSKRGGHRHQYAHHHQVDNNNHGSGRLRSSPPRVVGSGYYGLRDYNFTTERSKLNKLCEELYGITPNVHALANRYGGTYDIAQTISNTIFSSGSLDPWGGAAIRNVHIHGRNGNNNDHRRGVYSFRMKFGAHHLDLRGWHPSDPIDVQTVRLKEEHIIVSWIDEFFTSATATTTAIATAAATATRRQEEEVVVDEETHVDAAA